ncbi:hypothetical protein [Nocardioides sp. CF8]|uniref:hypothetical protein n=1 Tax=Nocardioides sp. CF8 TaxID=110319 RepID=UPI000684AAAB|nr:hypothetical protein [Nocardioides sp. CF8]
MQIKGDFNTRRPFPRWRGIAAGLGRASLDGPGFRRILYGVLVAADVPDSPQLRAEAALLCFFDNAFASHATAARIWGVPVRLPPDEHVTVPEVGHRLRRAGVTCHVRSDADVSVVGGVRVSTLPDLFVELATLLPLVELVVAGDWMVRRKGVRVDQLIQAAGSAGGRAGDLARRAAAYVREKVDSPMETRLRMLLVLAGIPEPRVNLEIRTEDGEVLRRYDLSWPGVRVIVEYDGRHHVERVEQWEADLTRREAIDDSEWRIVVIVSSGIYKHPEHTVQRVHTLLRARGLAGLPARPREDWRPHFPGWADVA